MTATDPVLETRKSKEIRNPKGRSEYKLAYNRVRKVAHANEFHGNSKLTLTELAMRGRRGDLEGRCERKRRGSGGSFMAEGVKGGSIRVSR